MLCLRGSCQPGHALPRRVTARPLSFFGDLIPTPLCCVQASATLRKSPIQVSFQIETHYCQLLHKAQPVDKCTCLQFVAPMASFPSLKNEAWLLQLTSSKPTFRTHNWQPSLPPSAVHACNVAKVCTDGLCTPVPGHSCRCLFPLTLLCMSVSFLQCQQHFG